MNGVGSSYGGGLFALASQEGLTSRIQEELAVLGESFEAQPQFLTLLASPSLTKAERCQILEDSFRGRVHPYVLNFLKLLTEKGYIRHFSACREAYTAAYHEAEGILSVTVTSARPLTETQAQQLRCKLEGRTGKKILLTTRIDPSLLGGLRLDYGGIRLEDTLSSRLDAIRELLTKTAG